MFGGGYVVDDIIKRTQFFLTLKGFREGGRSDFLATVEF